MVSKNLWGTTIYMYVCFRSNLSHFYEAKAFKIGKWFVIANVFLTYKSFSVEYSEIVTALQCIVKLNPGDKT